MAAPTQTDLATMKFSFKGEPFVVAAKAGIDTNTLAYQYGGEPASVPSAGGGGGGGGGSLAAGANIVIVCS